MRFCRLFAFLILLPGVYLGGADKKKPQQSYVYRPDQTAELDPGNLVTALHNCENWGFAAGLEAMLRQQQVDLNQRFWTMRIYGGELCVSEIPSPETLVRAVNGEFVLEDGRHVRLQLDFSPGAPSDVDSLIAGLEHHRIALLIWRGHPYYVAGATYDEHIGRDGSRLYEIKELRLANTFAQRPGITFEKGRDDPAKIGGVVTVKVSPA